jgi:hypothetical protein
MIIDTCIYLSIYAHRIYMRVKSNTHTHTHTHSISQSNPSFLDLLTQKLVNRCDCPMIVESLYARDSLRLPSLVASAAVRT